MLVRVSVSTFFRSMVASSLAATLAFSPLAASAAAVRSAATSSKKVDQAALLLDRLSFGARPGDLEQVRAMGAQAWLERQLQPERIDDSELERRLEAYPALRMSQTEQIARYPTPAMVRRAAKSGYLPQDSETRAILQDQVEFYQMRQQAKAEKAPTVGTVSTATPNPTLAAKSAAKTGHDSPVAQPTDADVQKGFAALQTSGDGMTMTDSRSQLAGGGTSSAAAADAMQVPAPESLEQATPAMAQDRVSALLQLPPDDRFQRLLHMSPAELIAVRKALRGDGTKVADGMTPLQKETLAALAGTNRMISGELFSARLLRDIYSERQLEAVMTDFWLNHFNVYIRKNGQMPSLLPEYEDTIRAHALGRFEDLLEATAKSPAMLEYLDNAQSIGPDSQAAGFVKKVGAKRSIGLNENYARELMELHTLGVNGGYTQKDVTEVAKVFTGWGIERPGEGGEFLFYSRRHEPGAKQVLGKTIRENGESEGEEVLHMLATSPATARFLSLELAQRFVSDTPSTALLDRMAATFLQSNGDIKAVLRTMVHAPEFFAPTTVNAKIKTPLEYVVSSVRATNADVQNPLPLAQALERLGMPLYGCQPPTGYKWDAETWLNSAALVNRMNFALLLASNKIGGTTVDTGALVTNAPARMVRAAVGDDAQRKEEVLENVVLPQGVSVQTRNAVLSQTDDSAVQQAMRDFGTAVPQPGKSGASKQIVSVTVNRRDLSAGPLKPNAQPVDKQGAVMLGLLLGSPEFQRR